MGIGKERIIALIKVKNEQVQSQSTLIRYLVVNVLILDFLVILLSTE